LRGEDQSAAGWGIGGSIEQLLPVKSRSGNGRPLRRRAAYW